MDSDVGTLMGQQLQLLCLFISRLFEGANVPLQRLK